MQFRTTLVVALLAAGHAGMLSGKPILRLRGDIDSCHHAAGLYAFFEEWSNETKRPDDIPDPSCKKGVVSPDLHICCTDECGSCGSHALCDDVGKYNEKTGKLADNCCRDRVAKSKRSCDKTHPPCVLSPDYAKELDTYKIDRPVRHAMDDCNKAINIAREKHGMGVDKGNFLSKLYLEGRTVYEKALEIAVKVSHLCDKKILEIEDGQAPLKAKIAGATAADKKVDLMTGTSKYDTWKDELESDQNEINFYKTIIENAKTVKTESTEGIQNVADLKAEVKLVRDVEPFQLKLNELVGDSNRVYEDAELLWKQWIDSGKDYDCGAPPPVEHAAFQCKDGNTKYSFRCEITCEVGYDDANASKNALKCLKQGKFGKELYGEWQGMASCVGVDCGEPPKIQSAKNPIQRIRFPNEAHYKCHEGHSMDGKATGQAAFAVKCGSTGNFLDDHSHKCQKIKCGSAPAYPNTESVPGLFYYADTVNYQCLTGYTLDEQPGGISNFSVSCLASGKFKTNLECKPVRCGPPPDFLHTIEKGKKTEKSFGESASFECRPGYSTDQRPNGPKEFTLQCGANGEFHLKGASPEIPLPTCRPVSAGMSPKVDHGNLASREMFYGEAAWVSADDGFSYVAKPKEGLSFELKVTTAGNYDNVHQFKPVECGKPPVVKKSKQEFKKDLAVFGDVLPYKCEDGYSTDATDHEAALAFTLVCESDADFSKVPDKGECVNIDDCIQHTCGPHGDCQDLLMDYKCNCDSGFEQVVDEDSGEKVCGNINDCGPEACGVGKCKDLINAYECICPNGYEQIGDGPMDKTCAAKTCGIPPEVDHSATSPIEAGVAKAFYTNDIMYQCDRGYTTDGKSEGHNHFSITCQADTSFTDTEDCKPVECGAAPSVENAIAVPKETTFNQSIRYKCDEGHTIDGTNEGDNHFSVTCQANGIYSDTQKCQPVTCGYPSEVANAFVESGEVYFPNKRAYTCFDGFTLDSKGDGDTSFEVECKASGNLTKAKKCMAVVCGNPPKHIHAMFATASDEGPVSYPQITEVTCRDGYTVGGDPDGNKSFGVNCLSTGKFSKYDEHECEPVKCGAIPAFENAELSTAVKAVDYYTTTATGCVCYFDHSRTDCACCQNGGCQCASDHPHQCVECGEGGGCGKPATMKSAPQEFGKNINFEETATYDCLPGYTAGGEPDASDHFLVECLASGELSYPPPDQQCRNVDACQQHTCGPRGTCIDTIGESIDAYTCNCSYGFAVKMVAGEKFCGNIDDCGSHKCGVGVCKDLIGDYTCICPAGHYVGFDDNEKTCIPVQCAPDTPTLEHGKLLTSHTGVVDFPISLRYKCNDGYSTDGSVGDSKKNFHANCKADGTLYGLSSCQPVSCGTPRILPFTTLVAPGPRNSVDYGETVTYNCIPGYYVGGTIEGKTEFSTECLASGVLADPLVCDPVSCGAAPVLPNAHPHIEPEVFYGMHLEYFCDYGYTLDGTADGATKFSRRCLATGEFETMTATHPCKPVSAGELPDIPNARISEYNGMTEESFELPITAHYPDAVEYHCLTGFTLTGGLDGATKFASFADASGTFVPSLPEKCLPITFYAHGKLKDSRNGVGLDGATVRIMGTDIVASSGSGFFTLMNIPPGVYNVKYEMSGYITVERKMTIQSNINVGGVMDVSMSPSMADDQWRAVVKWNARPTDLDTYGQWGYSKVCWYGRHKRGGNMEGTLEKDDTDGYGPETLFLNNVGKCTGSSQACDIKYQINDYTRSGTMLEKGATVTLYSGSRVVGSWKIQDCPTSVDASKNWWHVFTIDGRTNQLKWTCKDPPQPPVVPGITEEVYYFGQGDNVPYLNSRVPNMQRVVYQINYGGFREYKWSGLTQKKDFAVRWEGSVRINSQGTYTFYLTSDDGSQMWTDESMVINNGGLHGKQTRTGTMSLTSDLHAVKIDYFQKGGGSGCIFKYKGRDTNNRAVVVPQSALRVNPVLGGLTEEVFYFNQGDDLANLNGHVPNMAREVDFVNYEKTSGKFPGFEREDNFAIRFTGFVLIEIAGEYTFSISSDDGSKLWIQDQDLINDGGLHGYETKSASKPLTTGYHRLRMEYFEAGGDAGVKLEYKGPDTNDELRVIPKEKLRKAAGTPPVVDLHAGLKQMVYYYGGDPKDNGDSRYKMPLYNGKTPSKVDVASFINFGSTQNTWGGFNQKDHYAVRWTGSMVVKKSGTYTLKIESDDGSMLWWNDDREPMLVNGDGHGMVAKSASRSMTKDYPYALRIEYFEDGGGAGMKFSYKGPDTDNQMKIVPRRALLQTSPLTGLLLEGFYMGMGDWIPDTTGRMPNVQYNVPKIDWSPSENKWNGFDRVHDFAVRFTGSIVINHAGSYTFWIGSDDGCKLFMGDNYGELINNDGLHGYEEKEGTKDMTEGETTMMITYFQKDGGSAMRFFWKGQDSDNQKVIVGSAGGAGVFRRLAGPP